SYRAAFSRAHRGPYAASVGGDADDSSDVAAGWHAGERVVFAWHQRKDRVVCIAFDKAGHVAVKPAVLGAGRWPHVTAEGGGKARSSCARARATRGANRSRLPPPTPSRIGPHWRGARAKGSRATRPACA